MANVASIFCVQFSFQKTSNYARRGYFYPFAKQTFHWITTWFPRRGPFSTFCRLKFRFDFSDLRKGGMAVGKGNVHWDISFRVYLGPFTWSKMQWVNQRGLRFVRKSKFARKCMAHWITFCRAYLGPFVRFKMRRVIQRSLRCVGNLKFVWKRNVHLITPFRVD